MAWNVKESGQSVNRQFVSPRKENGLTNCVGQKGFSLLYFSSKRLNKLDFEASSYAGGFVSQYILTHLSGSIVR